jgi:hypothetical protein
MGSLDGEASQVHIVQFGAISRIDPTQGVPAVRAYMQSFSVVLSSCLPPWDYLGGWGSAQGTGIVALAIP